MSHEAEALNELIKGILTIVDNKMNAMTQIYDGIILTSEANANGKWQIKFNGQTRFLKPYGSIVPTKNMIVKVYVPQGNMSLAYFI